MVAAFAITQAVATVAISAGVGVVASVVSSCCQRPVYLTKNQDQEEVEELLQVENAQINPTKIALDTAQKDIRKETEEPFFYPVLEESLAWWEAWKVEQQRKSEIADSCISRCGKDLSKHSSESYDSSDRVIPVAV